MAEQHQADSPAKSTPSSDNYNKVLSFDIRQFHTAIGKDLATAKTDHVEAVARSREINKNYEAFLLTHQAQLEAFVK